MCLLNSRDFVFLLRCSVRIYNPGKHFFLCLMCKNLIVGDKNRYCNILVVNLYEYFSKNILMQITSYKLL